MLALCALAFGCSKQPRNRVPAEAPLADVVARTALDASQAPGRGSDTDTKTAWAPLDDPDAAQRSTCASNNDCGLTADGCAIRPDGQFQPRVLSEPGPLCFCDTALASCVRLEVKPVACTDDRQCRLVNLEGFEVPSKRRTPLKRKLRPCEDAEHIPQCRQGRCTIAVFSCFVALPAASARVG